MLLTIANWLLFGLAEAMDLFVNMFFGIFDMTAGNYLSYFPVLGTAYSLFRGLGYGLVFVFAAMGLIRFFQPGIFGGKESNDTPGGVLFKAMCAAALVYGGNYILEYIIEIATVPYDAFRKLSITESPSMGNIFSQLATGLLRTIEAPGIDAGASILVLVIILLVAFNFFKLVIEIAERYLLVGLMLFTSPPFFAMFASADTMQSFRSWIKMFISGCAMMFVSVFSCKLVLSGIASVATQGNGLAGDTLLRLLLVLGMCKAAQKTDSYLKQIGLGTAQTGGSLLEDILAVGRTAGSFAGNFTGGKGGSRTTVLGAAASTVGKYGKLGSRISGGWNEFKREYENGEDPTWKKITEAGRKASEERVETFPEKLMKNQLKPDQDKESIAGMAKDSAVSLYGTLNPESERKRTAAIEKTEEKKISETAAEKQVNHPGQELMNGKYTYTPEKPEGEEEIRLKIDASELAGKTIAVYEKILADDKIIFEQQDLKDEKQIIHFADIQSDLYDDDGDIYAVADDNTVLVATVLLTNLEKGKKYTVRGILSSEGSTIAETETGYEPDNQYGITELRYETDFSGLAGKKAVSEISVYLDEVPVATDEQGSEKNRTVYFPVISTYADNGNGGKTVTASKNAYVIDRIEYAGLKENTEYRVVSSLYDVSSGKAIYLENGTTIENRLFSGTGNGNKDVIIPFNAAAQAGKTLVVSEEIYLGEDHVASHINLNDEAQQVTVPEMKAVYNLNIIGGEPLAGSEILLRDITGGGETEITTDEKGIGYSSLIPGHQYSIRQKSVKDGYVLNSNTYYFTYPKSGEPSRASQTIYNYPVGTAVIKKTDIKTGKAVSGATVTVYRSGSAVATLKTDSRGQIYFDARKYIQEGSADFTYRETAAPQGYNLNSSTYKFSVDRQGKVSGTLNFKECPYGTVMITKTNEGGSPLSGARISVYTSTGKMIGQATTNSQGHIYFSAPEAGNYYYIEDVAPQGYTRADQKFVFSVDQYGRVSGTTSFINTVSGKGKGVQTGDNREITAYFTIMTVAILALISKRKRPKRKNISEYK